MSKRICVACKKAADRIRGRGMCDACYESARRRVNAGKATWRQLEKLGLALPLAQTPFEKALASSKK